MAERVLTIRMRVRDDGSVAVEKVAKGFDRLDRSTAQAERQGKKWERTARDQNRAADQFSGSLSRLRNLILGVAGAAGLGMLIRSGVRYREELVANEIALAGVISANMEFLDAQGNAVDGNAKWAASLAEAAKEMKGIEEQALATAATVPQITDAFIIALNAAKAAGTEIDMSVLRNLTVRVVQTAGALKVPMEQLRQEVRSLFMGDVTNDSLVAKTLFGDVTGSINEHIKALQRAGTFYEELEKRTEAYAKAAEEAANTLTGTWLNAKEVMASIMAEILDAPLDEAGKGLRDMFEWIQSHRAAIVGVFSAIVDGISGVVSATKEWIVEHRRAVETFVGLSIATGSAILGIKAMNVAIAALYNPVTQVLLAIAGISVLWEGVRRLGDLEIGGVKAKDYLFTIYRLAMIVAEGAAEELAALFETFRAFVRLAGTAITVAFGGIAEHVKRIFGELVDNLIGGIRLTLKAAAGVAGFLAPAVASQVRGALVWLDGFKTKMAAGLDDVKARMEVLAATAQATFNAVLTGVERDDIQIPDIGSWMMEKIKEGITRLAPQLQEALAAATGGLTMTSPALAVAGLGLDPKTLEAQKKLTDDYLAAVLAAQEEFIQRYESGQAKIVGITGDIQRDAEERRIAAIEDSIARELAERLHAIEIWYQAEEAAILASTDLQTHKDKQLELLQQQREAREAEARAAAQRAEQEQIAGTRAWLDKMQKLIRDRAGTIANDVTGLAVGAFESLRGLFDDLLGGLLDGSADIGDALEDFMQGLQRQWAQMISNMIARSAAGTETIGSQLKGMWDALGATQGLDAVLAGAGFGSVVGGIGSAIMGPNNYAAEGGSIGGAIGAIIGSAFYGNTAAGAAIGSALGSIVGGLIQKGKDWIEVAIVDGVAHIDEKGISAKARHELTRDVQRQIDLTIKGYERLIDLFPEELREKMRELVKPLDLSGGVESSDLRDESALDALSHFLREDLQQGAFDAYEEAIRFGLSEMGVDAARIFQLFEQWGTLQGAELQAAVRGYVETLVTAIDLQGILDPAKMLGEARRLSSMKPIDHLREVTDAISGAVASLGSLDLEDQQAAMQRINDLTRQYYDQHIMYLQQIDAIQAGIRQSIERQIEEIALAGMGDQEKVDFFYERIRELRLQLMDAQTPEEIQRLTQEIQGYVRQALGLVESANVTDETKAVNRDKLTAILEDILGISDARLDSVREQAQREAEKVANIYATAVDVFRQAVDDFVLHDPDTGGGGGGGGRVPRPRFPFPERDRDPLYPGIPFQPVKNQAAVDQALHETHRQMRDAFDRFAARLESRDGGVRIDFDEERLAAWGFRIKQLAKSELIAEARASGGRVFRGGIR